MSTIKAKKNINFVIKKVNDHYFFSPDDFMNNYQQATWEEKLNNMKVTSFKWSNFLMIIHKIG